MYTNPDNHYEQLNPRPFLSPGMKHSTMFTKMGTQGLTFSSKSQVNLHLNSNISSKKNQMARSMIKKQNNEMDSFIKEIRQKMGNLERTLSQHDRQITEIRQGKSKTTSYYSSSDSFYKSQSIPSINPQIVKYIKKQLQKEDCPFTSKFKNNIYSEINSIKSNIQNNYTLKNDLNFMFQKFETNISHLVHNTHINKQINEIRNKIKVQSQHIHQYFNQEINSKIKYLHDSNLQYFNDMNICVQNIKLTIQSMKEQYKPTFITSNQKCYSPKLIKYKQMLQKVGNSNEKQCHEMVVAGEVIYYLDTDGYLLDSNCYYLLDKDKKQIKIESKQLAIFSKYNLL